MKIRIINYENQKKKIRDEYTHNQNENQNNKLEKSRENIRKFTRNRRIPNFLKDYHCQLMNCINAQNLKKKYDKIGYSITTSFAYDKLFTKQLNFTLTLSFN